MVSRKQEPEPTSASRAAGSREPAGGGPEERGERGADGDAATASPGRLSLDTADRHQLVLRLRRIEGQVRGLQRMVEEGRYCPEILTQLAAVQASLKGAGAVLLQGHLRHCVTDAIRSEDPVRAETVYRELTHLFDKYSR